MKTKHFFLFLLLFSIIGISCNKEKTYEVRYEVEKNYPDQTLIEWTTSDGGISGGSIYNNSSWHIIYGDVYSYSFTGPEGMEILLTGQNAVIRLYIDNELTMKAESTYGVKAEINYTL